MRKPSLRRIRKAPGILLLFFLLGLLIYLLGWSSLLSLKSVEIEGTSRNSEINSALFSPETHLKLRRPLARINTSLLNRKLKTLDWVKSETITKDWMQGVLRVRIAERIPVAQYTDEKYGTTFLDSDGIAFIAKSSSSLPVITFSHISDSSKSAVATLISGLPAELLSALTGINVVSREFIESRERSRGGELLIRWGSPSELPLKVQIFHRLVALPENAKVVVVDVSSPRSPLVK